MYFSTNQTYDTIDHNILQNKLAYYGLKGSLLLLFKGDLQNRKQYTVIEQINLPTTDILPTTFGVPQGSVLGQLLFIIYIKDFSQDRQLFNLLMYTDDTTLSTSLNSLSEKIPQNTITETIIK